MEIYRPHPETALIEPLTPREQEILSLLAEKYTNQEIADQLTLALNSVKWYARQIYQKLGVKNRRQAVFKARELAILRRNSHPDLANNLPAQLTPFIGRQSEMETIKDLIGDPACRLLTLLGPGGFGKTRLAIQLASQLIEDQAFAFPDGVLFFSLASLNSPAALIPSLMIQLKLSLNGREDQRTKLIEFLQDKKLLLIFDSFEHLVTDESIDLLIDMLKSAPRIKVLVTSRIRLGMVGEQVYPVAGMETPAGIETQNPNNLLAKALNFSSVQLFLQCARKVLPSFSLNQENISPVVRICQLLQGVPLGIILASAWIQVLNCQQILTQVEQGIDFLETSWHDVPKRQRSLRAVLEGSWNLLTQDEQEAGGKLSLFRDCFSTQLATEVFHISLKTLSALVDKSWLQRQPGDVFSVHELMRQYASDRLHQNTVLEGASLQQFCAYYNQFLLQRGREWHTPQQREGTVAMERQIRNIEAAWPRLVEREASETIRGSFESLCTYYANNGDFRGGETACESIVDKYGGVLQAARPANPSDTQILAKALAWKGHFHQDWDTALDLLNQSLILYSDPSMEGIDIRQEVAFVHSQIGDRYSLNDRQQAHMHYSRALELSLELEDDWMVAQGCYLLGGLDWALGDYETAQQKMKQSLTIQRRMGDLQGALLSLNDMGLIRKHLGYFDEAEHLHRESLAMAKELGLPLDVATITSNLSQTLIIRGKFRQAYSCSLEAIALFNRLSHSYNDLTHAYGAAAHASLHLGQYAKVREYAWMGLNFSGKYHDDQEVGFIHQFLGLAALAEGSLEEARNHLEGGYLLLQQIQQNVAANALAGLALLNLQQGQPDQACQSLIKAFETILSKQAIIPGLHAMPVAALFFVTRGEIERGLEICALACRYPFVRNSRWFRQVVGNKIDQAASNLAPDQREACLQRGKVLDFWDTVKHLVGDFQV